MERAGGHDDIFIESTLKIDDKSIQSSRLPDNPCIL